MNTLEKAKVVEALSIGAPALNELLTGAALHAHAKTDLPALNAIRLKVENTSLVAEATDRYRLIKGSIPVFIVNNESGTLADTIISLSDVKRVITLAKGLDKRAAITLTRSGDILSVSSGGDSLTLSVLDSNFPDFKPILEAAGEPAALTSIYFNPKFYGDLSKLAGKAGVLVTFGVSELKPMKFTISGELVEWHGAIMPMKRA